MSCGEAGRPHLWLDETPCPLAGIQVKNGALWWVAQVPPSVVRNGEQHMRLVAGDGTVIWVARVPITWPAEVLADPEGWVANVGRIILEQPVVLEGSKPGDPYPRVVDFS